MVTALASHPPMHASAMLAPELGGLATWRATTTIGAPIEDHYAERWRQWQQANAQSSRRSAVCARVVFTVIFTILTGWLGWLLSSPLWA